MIENTKSTAVFACQAAYVQEFIWNEKVRQRARDLGLSVTLPPVRGEPYSKREWAEILADAEAIFTSWGSPQLDETVLGRNTRLKFVGHAAGSAAGITSEHLFDRGVHVCTANWIMARQVARWSLMMTLFSVTRMLDYTQFGAHSPIVWDNRERARGITDSVVGIWGYGDISKWLIHFLKPFEPKEILICSRSTSAEKARGEGMRKVEFDELFEESDVIHLLQGLTESTLQMVGEEQLQAIRSGGTLINAGRAQLVNPEALLAELKRNRITAILDVHYKEPPPADSPFHGMPNVILTPHSAGLEGPPPYGCAMLEEYDRLLRGVPLEMELDLARTTLMTDGRLAFRK